MDEKNQTSNENDKGLITPSQTENSVAAAPEIKGETTMPTQAVSQEAGADQMPDLANESDTPPTDAPLNQLEGEKTTNESPAKVKHSKKKLILVIMVASLVVIALSVAAYFAFMKDESSVKTEDAKATNATTNAETVSDEVDSAIKKVDETADVSADDLSDTKLEL